MLEQHFYYINYSINARSMQWRFVALLLCIGISAVLEQNQRTADATLTGSKVQWGA